jgi:arsenate reductase/ArsR family transcriptional regulator
MLETFETVAKAVADPSRIRILKLLEGGELCVCQITAVMDLAPATISKHLAALKTAGLLQHRRDAKWVHYRLAERALNLYAPHFLELVKSSMQGDPTVAEDLRVLAQVNALPVQVLCDRGRAALEPKILSPEGTACCGEQP